MVFDSDEVIKACATFETELLARLAEKTKSTTVEAYVGLLYSAAEHLAECKAIMDISRKMK